MTEDFNNPALEDAEILPTDIVFDCPHCGHNLVVDYRAAGLQVPCPSCGAIIQAPIPEGMLLEDLDTDPGELLQQLLQTRRMLVKAEVTAQQMGEKVVELTEQVAAMRSALLSVKARIENLQEATRIAQESQEEALAVLAAIGGH